MSDARTPTLTQTRIKDGWWEGILTGCGGEATVEAWHQDRQLDGVQLGEAPDGSRTVRVPIAASVLAEGVQTVLLQVDGQVLASFTVVAGLPLEEDLRAEIGLLRAELDLLKRAFRRHCAETAG